MAGLITALVSCLMLVLSFYLFAQLYRTVAIWYAWVGLTLAVGVAAVVLAAPGLHDRAVGCRTVFSLVLGALAITGTILVVAPVLWTGL
jgi:ABC-type multidrug transport system permease subunit